MKIKEFKCCSCSNNDFKFMTHSSNSNMVGIYCSRCGKWLKWADKGEKNLMKLAESENTEV